MSKTTKKTTAKGAGGAARAPKAIPTVADTGKGGKSAGRPVKRAKSKGPKAWRNRIVAHADVNPLELLAHPMNYKAHPQHQEQALSGAISDVGFLRSVTVNRKTGTIIDGHLRVALAIKQQQATIPVEYVELSEHEERAALASLDPIGSLAEQSDDALAELAESLGKGMENVREMLGSILGEDTEEDAPREADSRKPAANTKATIGEFRFELTRKQYEAWAEEIREQVGFDNDSCCEEIKRRLGLSAV